jgi:hypothetical protein
VVLFTYESVIEKGHISLVMNFISSYAPGVI